MAERVFNTGQGRVFYQQGGARPDHTYDYLGAARLGGLTIPKGDITPVRNPSAVAYGQFDEVDEIQGAADRPTTSMIARLGLANVLLEDNGCPFDAQVHYGKCTSPSDYKSWELIIHFERARFTSISSDDLTALDESGAITLTGDMSARKVWEILPMNVTEVAAAEVLRWVTDVIIADYVSCGDCGWESGGDKHIYAITKSSAGSAGYPQLLLESLDGGATWTAYQIDNLAALEQPYAVTVVGDWIVVTAQDETGAAAGVTNIQIADKDDLGTWTENAGTAGGATGFANGGPRGVFALSSSQLWLCGFNGYVYFMSDPSGVPTIQSTGTPASGEDLTAIHGCDSQNLVAVGANGTVIYTNNGGKVWSAAADSPCADDINCVWVRSQYCWLVGTAAGELYYTVDGGATWYSKVLPVTFTSVTDIAFSDHADSPFGFLSGCDGSSGLLLRTINGGSTWTALPDGVSTLPTCHELTAVATCNKANVVVAVGVKGTGVVGDDGIIAVGS